MTHVGDQQMAFQGRVAADLEVRQAQLALLVFENPFDRPAPERHVQDRSQRHARRGIADEILDLTGIECIARQSTSTVPPRRHLAAASTAQT